MQNAAPVVATPQAPPGITTIQPLPSGGVQITTPQPMRPLTSREIGAIRSRRDDISTQLTSAMDRRENLTDELKDAPPGAQPGLLAQIQVLDERIVRIEQDMEASGQMLRTGLTVDNGTTLVAPREFGSGDPSNDAERGAAMGAVVLLPILAIYKIARFRRRRRRGNASESTSSDQEARMERLEQAVDAIALEIERVGESQRYQTKVLAEANLMPAMSASRSGEPVRAREYDR